MFNEALAHFVSIILTFSARSGTDEYRDEAISELFKMNQKVAAQRSQQHAFYIIIHLDSNNNSMTL